VLKIAIPLRALFFVLRLFLVDLLDELSSLESPLLSLSLSLSESESEPLQRRFVFPRIEEEFKLDGPELRLMPCKHKGGILLKGRAPECATPANTNKILLWFGRR
jgi:hypothetical protein